MIAILVGTLLGTLIGCSGDKNGNSVELGFESLEITPTEGVTTSSTLLCEATLLSSLNVDTYPVTYEWRVGSTTSEGNEITLDPATVVPQMQVSCTASIGSEENSYSETAVVIVDNTPPTISSFAIAPDVAYVDSTFELTAEFGDGDTTQEDMLDLDIEWHVVQADGTDLLVEGETGYTFENGNLNRFEKGDSVYTMGVVSDGTDTSEIVQSNIVEIENSPPTTPVVSILADNEPADPDTDNLTCVADQVVDVDGDSITYTFTWFDPSGNVVSSSSGLDNTNTLASDELKSEGDWSCQVQVSDGLELITGEASYLVQYPECIFTAVVFVNGVSFHSIEYPFQDLDTQVSLGMVVFSTTGPLQAEVDNYVHEDVNGIIQSSTFDDPDEWWHGTLSSGGTSITNGTFKTSSSYGRLTLKNGDYTLTPYHRHSIDIQVTNNMSGIRFMFSENSANSNCGTPLNLGGCPQEQSKEYEIGIYRAAASPYYQETCFNMEYNLLGPNQWGLFADCAPLPMTIPAGVHTFVIETTYSNACGL